MKIKVRIGGISPILFNRFGEDDGNAIENGSSPAITGDTRGTPRDQATKSCYRDDKGFLYVPGANLFSALIEAGIFQKVGRSKLTTQKSSLVPAGIAVDEMMLPFGTKDFEVDSRRIVNPATKGARLRHRGRLDKWHLEFTLDVDTTMFSPKVVRQLVDDAGKKIGLGDYRPARKGPFGRFVVTKWDEEQEKKAA